MQGDQPQYTEALVIENGKITFAGRKADADSKYNNAIEIDLKGKTMTPGFVEGHAHFHGFGTHAVGANLLASPDGNCNSIDESRQTMKDWYAKKGTDKTRGWIFGLDYDDYKNHYRVSGVKLALDGSPQGRTAWRTVPYLLPPDGQEMGYKGYPTISNDEDVRKVVDTAFANNGQLIAHFNGDAAADRLFKAMAH